MSRSKGSQFEELATNFLMKKGLRIVERNYSCRLGELDIIAETDGILVFVEVKYRNNNRFGEPFAFVDHKKQRRMIATAQHFCQNQGIGESRPMRFDVVSIQPRNNEFDIQWLENAFTTNGF